MDKDTRGFLIFLFGVIVLIFLEISMCSCKDYLQTKNAIDRGYVQKNELIGGKVYKTWVKEQNDAKSN